MGDVLPFKRPKAKPRDGGTLCQNGHHKWKVDKKQRFDTKFGRLVTVYRCERCGLEKVVGT